VERKVQLVNWAGDPTRQVEHLFKTTHQAGFWIEEIIQSPRLPVPSSPSPPVPQSPPLPHMPVFNSTLILTFLLAIGLFFFIKASVKDRIEQMVLETSESEADLLPRLQQYFTDRAYRIVSVDRETTIVTFEGLVRPSVVLATLLSGLAAGGALCMALVLSYLFPAAGNSFGLLLLVAPLAGWFYWKGSSRTEQVQLKVEPQAETTLLARTLIKIRGHRDELAVFQETLKLCVHEEIK
jgi:hypothetical protein